MFCSKVIARIYFNCAEAEACQTGHSGSSRSPFARSHTAITMKAMLCMGGLFLSLHGHAQLVTSELNNASSDLGQTFPICRDWQVVNVVTGVNGSCSIEFSPDSKRLATLRSDGRASVWSIEAEGAPKELFVLKAKEPITSVSHCPTGGLLVTAGAFGEICLWRSSDGKLINRASGSNTVDGVWDAWFSKDGSVIGFAPPAFGIQEVYYVAVTNVGHKALRGYWGESYYWPELYHRCDGAWRNNLCRYVAIQHKSCPADVRIWDTRKREDVWLLSDFPDNREPCLTAVLSEDHNLFIATTGARLGDASIAALPLMVWEHNTKPSPEVLCPPCVEMKGTLAADVLRESDVADLVLSPRKDYLLSWHANYQVVAVWDIARMKFVGVLKTEEEIRGCYAFTPDGKTIGTLTTSGSLLLWRQVHEELSSTNAPKALRNTTASPTNAAPEK